MLILGILLGQLPGVGILGMTIAILGTILSIILGLVLVSTDGGAISTTHGTGGLVIMTHSIMVHIFTTTIITDIMHTTMAHISTIVPSTTVQEDAFRVI